MGEILCQDIQRMQSELRPIEGDRIAGLQKTLKIPYREIDGPHGLNQPAPQRLGGPNRDRIYECAIERLRTKIAIRDHALAEIQALQVGDVAYVTVPAEYFSALGVRIKERSAFEHTCVVSMANGMVGYVPTREAFDRGGYEPTLGMSSKLCAEAGDIIAEAAVSLLEKLRSLTESR